MRWSRVAHLSGRCGNDTCNRSVSNDHLTAFATPKPSSALTPAGTSMSIFVERGSASSGTKAITLASSQRKIPGTAGFMRNGGSVAGTPSLSAPTIGRSKVAVTLSPVTVNPGLTFGPHPIAAAAATDTAASNTLRERMSPPRLV